MSELQELLDTIADKQRTASRDERIGYELLKLAIHHSRLTSEEIAGIYSDVTTRPAIGTPDSFREAILSKYHAQRLLYIWIHDYAGPLALAAHLRFEFVVRAGAPSFLHTLCQETQPLLSRGAWASLGNTTEAFRRRLDVMYELVAVCYAGYAHSIQCPPTVVRAIDALSHSMPSLRKNRYQVVSRRTGSTPF
ncbi:uncharacterized protein JCM6883_004406 [Sporobolomyces salmoneus]|uniref:uncharacterized protein n=1 Tax=Sporobolomyces salmoneus TaxID=183962 RepID=UPI00316BC22E